MTATTGSQDAPRLKPAAQVFVHPAALCESDDVGAGTRVWAFAHVMQGAVIGRECNIGGHAFIETGARIGDRVTIKNQAMIWNGVTLEDDVFVGPGAILTNDRYPRSARADQTSQVYSCSENWLVPTTVRRGATIGAGAVILCGVSIGSSAMVGAGAVVTRDVPDHGLVVGNPARAIGWVCLCGARLNAVAREPEVSTCAESACPRCGRRYEFGEPVKVGPQTTR